MTSCPKIVQWVNVSNRTNPVTQVADVAVKKQSDNAVLPAPFVETGSANKSVPISTIRQYPPKIIFIGDIFCQTFV